MRMPHGPIPRGTGECLKRQSRRDYAAGAVASQRPLGLPFGPCVDGASLRQSGRVPICGVQTPASDPKSLFQLSAAYHMPALGDSTGNVENAVENHRYGSAE